MYTAPTPIYLLSLPQAVSMGVGKVIQEEGQRSLCANAEHSDSADLRGQVQELQRQLQESRKENDVLLDKATRALVAKVCLPPILQHAALHAAPIGNIRRESTLCLGSLATSPISGSFGHDPRPMYYDRTYTIVISQS